MERRTYGRERRSTQILEKTDESKRADRKHKLLVEKADRKSY